MDLRELKFRIGIETIKRTRQTVAEAIRTVVGGTVRHVRTPTCRSAVPGACDQLSQRV